MWFRSDKEARPKGQGIEESEDISPPKLLRVTIHVGECPRCISWAHRWHLPIQGGKNMRGCQDSELSNFLGWKVTEGRKEVPHIYIHSAAALLSALFENPCQRARSRPLAGRVCATSAGPPDFHPGLSWPRVSVGCCRGGFTVSFQESKLTSFSPLSRVPGRSEHLFFTLAKRHCLEWAACIIHPSVHGQKHLEGHSHPGNAPGFLNYV